MASTTLPEANTSPLIIDPLEKAIPIGNHHSYRVIWGYMLVLGREGSLKLTTKNAPKNRCVGDTMFPIAAGLFSYVENLLVLQRLGKQFLHQSIMGFQVSPKTAAKMPPAPKLKPMNYKTQLCGNLAHNDSQFHPPSRRSPRWSGRWWFQIFFLFSLLFGEDSHFD